MKRNKSHAEKRSGNGSFDQFYRKFTGSSLVKQSLSEGYLSTKYPSRALDSWSAAAVAASERRREEAEAKAVEGIPPALVLLVRKQEQDGKWPTNDSDLIRVLGSGHGIPDSPEGIPLWKWTVAMCLAFMRQFPEHHDFCSKSYERGAFFVSDEHLLETARQQLPPIDFPHPLDAEMVRMGRWRECVDRTLRREGFQAFILSSATSEEPNRLESESKHKTRQQTKMTKREISGMLWRANALRNIGVARLKGRKGSHDISRAGEILQDSLPLYQGLAKRLEEENDDAMDQVFATPLCQQLEPDIDASNVEQVNNEKQLKDNEMQGTGEQGVLKEISKETQSALTSLMEKQSSCKQDKEAYIDNILGHEILLARELQLTKRRNKGASTSKLLEHWTKPIPALKEASRLQKATMPSPRPEWDQSVTHSSWSTRNTRVSRKKMERRRSRMSANQDTQSTTELHQQPSRGVVQTTRASVQDESHQQLSHAERQRQAQSALKIERQREHVDDRLSIVIKRIAAYETLVKQIREELPRASNRFRTAPTHAERNHAFDKVTESLGKIRLATCALIEALVLWRKARLELDALRQEGDETSKAGPLPFIWDGSNILLKVATNLDFLDTSPQLKQWYGKELKLRRNPFVLAVRFENRPASPVSAVRKVIVDGKQVTKVSTQLAQQREVQVQALDEAWSVIELGPRWWPTCSKDEWLRVRLAEKILLEEVRWHSQFRHVLSLS